MKEVKLSDPQEYILTSTQAINIFLGGVGCFDKDTLINTIEGYKCIKDVKQGDFVLSLNQLTNELEYKVVRERFKYNSGDIRQNIIIFTLNNGVQIKCTENHEFYFEGDWHSAKRIARRKMEACIENKQSLLCEQLRKVTNSKSPRRKSSCHNEAINGSMWISKNSIKVCRSSKIKNTEDAQACCSTMDTQSREQEDSKSQERKQAGQSCCKFGMEHKAGECDSFIQNRTSNQCRGESPKLVTKRSTGLRIESDEKKRNDVQADRKGDESELFNSERLLHKKLDAREISIDEIKSIEYGNCEYIYDLEVSDNHNYVITESNIIVHNSGKTHLDGIISMNFVQNFPDIKGFIGANTHQQISTSTLSRIYEIWRDYFGMVQGVDYVVGVIPPPHFKRIHTFDNQAYAHLIHFANGAVIFKGSLENPKVHDGKEFGWAILDETKDTKESAVKEVIIARMRQMGMYACNGEVYDQEELEKRVEEGSVSQEETEVDKQYRDNATGLLVRPFNPLYISTSPAKVEWINEWFEFENYEAEINSLIFSETTYFQKEFKDKCVAISSTYHNRENLPVGYIQKVIDNNTDIEAKRLVYANPFSKGGREFYSGFDRTIHVKNCPIKEDYPLHITFDKNVVPYHPLVIWQIIDKGELQVLRAIDEICLKNPNNTTEKLCQTFERKYGMDLDSGLFYYGDATARARSVDSDENYYEVVRRVLRPYISTNSDRVERSNPGIIARKNFINNLFEGRVKGWSIEIDPKCKNLIADYEFIKEDVNGKKEKKVIKDPATGETYQERGHCFAANTLISTKRGEIPIQMITFGDYVLTRKGYRKVTFAGITGVNRVVKDYNIGGVITTVTPDHPYFTVEDGFSEIDTISSNKTFVTNRVWKEKRKKLMGINSTDTHSRRMQVNGTTLKGGVGSMELEQNDMLTDMFGSEITGRSKKDIISIIKMKIRQTTSLRILNPFTIRNIYQNIVGMFQKKGEFKEIKTLTKQDHLLRNGTKAKRVENGIGNTVESQQLDQKGSLIAKNVELNSQPQVKTKQRAIVLRDVERDHRLELSELKERKLEISSSSNERVVDFVYDLTVEEEHEFFANGILVHNCSDASDYLLITILKQLFQRFNRANG